MTPHPWHHSQGQCPPILGITLHRPWSWAFFHGGPGEWKDVENRKAAFPNVPPGTWLALHNGQHWDSKAEALIKGRLPKTASLSRKDCPAGVIVGAVRVGHINRALVRGVAPTSSSRWHLAWDTAIWLSPERHLLAKPIPFTHGWFNAWRLPPEAMAEIKEQLGLACLL